MFDFLLDASGRCCCEQSEDVGALCSRLGAWPPALVEVRCTCSQLFVSGSKSENKSRVIA